MEVFVTVGMGPWPFTRLVSAAGALADEHDVFAQIGPSELTPGCEHARYLTPDEVMRRLRSADVVVTHAGNTVRLVQRLGKIPIVMARQAVWHEMGNDHQVEYLRREERARRVVAVWNAGELRAAVERHPACERELLAESRLEPPTSAQQVVTVVNRAWRRTGGNPFSRHPMRRYAYAWAQLAERKGVHLDLGCGEGVLLLALVRSTALRCEGADPHSARLDALRAAHPDLRLTLVRPDRPLPYPDAAFDSVSLLDVLEHAADHRMLLAEANRVLKPGGMLVLTVPARHLFSFLDPDQFKLRSPRLHRLAYSARFGRATYVQRFAHREDGLFGDMSMGASQHHNFEPEQLASLLTQTGFRITDLSGANYFWRLLHAPALVAGPRARRVLDWLIWIDGRAFRSANLFISAERYR